MQVKDSCEMVYCVAPMVAHNSLDVRLVLGRLRSGRGIISLGGLPQEGVGHGLTVERPAARIDHQGDQQKLNNSSERGRHSWLFNLIFEQYTTVDPSVKTIMH